MTDSHMQFYESAINHSLKPSKDPFNLNLAVLNTSPFHQDDYFDKKTGKFLGRGGTDEIRFIDETDWKAKRLNEYSTSGLILNDEVFKKVIMYYGQFTDRKVHKFEVSIKKTIGFDTGYDSSRDIVILNISKDRLGKYLFNRYDVINMHEHETYSHGWERRNLWFKEKRKYNFTDDFDVFESKAVHHQVKTSSWNKLTKSRTSFYSLIYDHYRNYLTLEEQMIYFPTYFKK